MRIKIEIVVDGNEDTLRAVKHLRETLETQWITGTEVIAFIDAKEMESSK